MLGNNCFDEDGYFGNSPMKLQICGLQSIHLVCEIQDHSYSYCTVEDVFCKAQLFQLKIGIMSAGVHKGEITL